MKKPLLLAGLVVLVVAVLAESLGMQVTASNSMRLDCGAGCGKTSHLSLTILAPEHSILGKPTMSAAFIDRVLAAAHSPAAGSGQTFYDAGVTSGIDPAWSLSFFHHESDDGTTGEARVSLSMGNMRCLGPGYEDLHPMCRDNFAWFPSWKDGIVAWYCMMLNGYVRGGITGSPCSTVERIIPTYAPSSDGNDEQAYINAVIASVAAYRAGQV